jgi:hypothetical protein
MVREVTLRCSNCHCGVKVEVQTLDIEKINRRIERIDTKFNDLLFTVVKDGKDST